MKIFRYFLFLLLLSAPAFAQVFSATNVDDSTAGWRYCWAGGVGAQNCSPGGTGNVTVGPTQTAPNASPSVDGSSLLNGFTGTAFTDVLFLYEAGAHNTAATFVADYQAYVTATAQDLEFDTYQYLHASLDEFMWGSQCHIGGFWQIWNSLAGTWNNTTVACTFSLNTFHHIQWYVHRIPGDTSCTGHPCMYYDTLVIDGVVNSINTTYPAGILPGTFADMTGLNFQLDTNGGGGAISQSVDQVSLTGYAAVSYGTTGVISPSRVTDWSRAGLPGSNLPSSSWTKCGATVSAYTGSTAAIQTAVNACGANQYVLLGPGTFSLTSGQITLKSNMALRGSGSNSTFIVIGASAGGSCQLVSCFIKIESSDVTYFNQPPPNVCNITGGTSQGSTSITVTNAAGTCPASISTSSTTPTLLYIEKAETGYSQVSATAVPTGTAVDNGNLFVCADVYVSPNGCSNNSPSIENTHRGQWEATYATANVAGVLTLADPLKWPNYPGNIRMWIQQSIGTVGVEALSIDDSSSGVASPIGIFGAVKWWVSGVVIQNIPKWGLETFQVEHGLIKDSYFYKTFPPNADDYCIRFEGAGQVLIQNNIFQQCYAGIVFDGPSSGMVIGYNFAIDANYQSDYMRGMFFEHGVNGYNLFEGNAATNVVADGNHGTASMDTLHRNFLWGWEECNNGQCGATTLKDSGTNPVESFIGSRYWNLTGNVFGTPGFHNAYKNIATLGGWDKLELVLGNPNFAGGTAGIPADSLVPSTALLWANYDVITAAVRFCGDASDTGWVATCGSVSEVPTGASTYPSALPTLGDTAIGQGALPASFYLFSLPTWFGTVPFPPIGPEVTGGNVKQCAGTLNPPVSSSFNGVAALSTTTGCSSLNTVWGGHVNAIPAMKCALSTMGIALDGTGAVKPFDGPTCYGGTAGAPAVSLSPTSPMAFGNQAIGVPANRNITLTNTGTATLNITSIVPPPATDFTIASTTCASILAAGNSCTVTVTFSPLSAGAKSSNVTFNTNAASSPNVENLTGTGVGSAAPPGTAQMYVFSGNQPAPGANFTSLWNTGVVNGVVLVFGWNTIESNDGLHTMNWTTFDTTIGNYTSAFPGIKIAVLFAPAKDISPNTFTPTYIMTGAAYDTCACPSYAGSGATATGCAKGNVNNDTTIIPSPFNATFKTNWNNFISLAFAHLRAASYSTSIGYTVFGGQKGGENFPVCSAQQTALVSPATTAQLKVAWTAMVDTLDSNIKTANTSNFTTFVGVGCIGNSSPSTGNNCDLADSIAATNNKYGVGLRITCLQAADMTDYAGGAPGCGDWVANFNSYNLPKDLQQGQESSPTGACASTATTLSNLLPFAGQHWGPSSVRVYEILFNDGLGTWVNGYTDACYPVTCVTGSCPYVPNSTAISALLNGLAPAANIVGGNTIINGNVIIH